MDTEAILTLLDGTGTLGLMTLVAVALLRGWVVTRREFEAMRRDRDRWLSITLRGADLAERGTSLASRAASVLEDTE